MDSKGAIFYIQKRIGKNNKTFSCYKFRTMKPESKYLLKKILIKNPNFKSEFENTRKIKNDPRITNIGKFLRFSSEIKKYGNDFEKAFFIKPGISGLWQVSGRNNLSYEKRVELDIFYSKNTSFLLDIKIFIKTLVILIIPFGKGGF